MKDTAVSSRDDARGVHLIALCEVPADRLGRRALAADVAVAHRALEHDVVEAVAFVEQRGVAHFVQHDPKAACPDRLGGFRVGGFRRVLAKVASVISLAPPLLKRSAVLAESKLLATAAAVVVSPLPCAQPHRATGRQNATAKVTRAEADRAMAGTRAQRPNAYRLALPCGRSVSTAASARGRGRPPTAHLLGDLPPVSWSGLSRPSSSPR